MFYISMYSGCSIFLCIPDVLWALFFFHCKLYVVLLCGFYCGIGDCDRVDSIASMPNGVDSMIDSATTGVRDEVECVVVSNI